MDFYESMLQSDPFLTPEELLRRQVAGNAAPRVLPKATSKTSVGGTLTNNVKPGDSSMLPQTARGMADYFTRRGIDAYAAEPDVSGLQQYAKQRAQEGESAMLNALAANYAGRRFEPVQAQFLKRAMAAQEPLKVGNAGYITPGGEYVKDPTYSQDRQAEKYLQLGQLYSGQALREDQAEADRANRLAIAGMRGANSGADDARLWRAEDKLRGDFDKATQNLETELGATRKITDIISATPPGSRPDAITQQSLVILLNKFLDPGSVVREGEFDRVVKAQGLEGRARNLQAYLLRGEPLNDEAIKQISSLAALYQRAAEAKLMSVAQNYSQLARARGLDPTAVIVNPAYRGNGGSSDDPLNLFGRGQ